MQHVRKEINKTRFAIYFGIGALVLVLARVAVTQSGYTVALNKSESLETAIYFVSPLDDEVERGEYVYFPSPPNPYSSGRLVKRVVGVEGDLVEVNDREISVNGKAIGRAKPLTRRGDVLTPINEGIIPEGYIFVAGDHKDSFDSRYGEFGFIPKYALKGVAREIF